MKTKRKDTELVIAVDIVDRRDTTDYNAQKWPRTGLGGRIIPYHPTPPVVGKIETTPSTGVTGTMTAKRLMKHSKPKQQNPKAEQRLKESHHLADFAERRITIGETAMKWRILLKNATKPMKTGVEQHIIILS